MKIKSDIQIAQETEMKDIREIAKSAGLDEKYIELYGNYMAKVDYRLLDEKSDAKDGKVILGLSGNPGAAATGLLCVGFPFMRKLSGRSDITFSQATAYLGVDFKKSSPVTRILKGHSDFKNGMLYFTPLSNQHNGSVSSMSDCDLLAVIPAGSKPLAAGDKLEVYIL